jgi:hypothetical protein
MNDPFLPQMDSVGLSFEEVSCLLQEASTIDSRCVIQKFTSMGPNFGVIYYFHNLDSFDRTTELDMNDPESWKISNVRWQTVATTLRDKTRATITANRVLEERNLRLEEENRLLKTKIQELESSKRRKVE